MNYTLRSILTQFTIRDLLWLFILSAVATCWWKDRTMQEERVVESVTKADAEKEKYKKATKRTESGFERIAKLTQEMETEVEKRLKMRPPGELKDGSRFLGSVSSSTKTYQDLEDENKELRMKIRTLENEDAKQTSQ